MGSKPRAFKHQLDATRVRALGGAIAEAVPAFDRHRFVSLATSGLDDLELKARVRHLIDCLHRCLPQPFPRAIAAIRDAARHDAAVRGGEGRILRGFAAWPLIDYVGDHGLEHVTVALDALRVLTPLFSAEFAIRPFLVSATAETLAAVEGFTTSDDEHVRRLASEGTRPLLPWGVRLEAFRRDPSAVVEILERLRRDPSEYVRRSVANNLNDIAKDHPDTVVAICERWSSEGVDSRLIARALRTLVKRGNRQALAVLGFAAAPKVAVSNLRLSPTRVREGQSVAISFDLRSSSVRVQKINIDYAVHFVKANGGRSARVFKLRRLALAPNEVVSVRKQHSMKAVTTRVHYPGTHTIELRVNGASAGRTDFELVTTERG